MQVNNTPNNAAWRCYQIFRSLPAFKGTPAGVAFGRAFGMLECNIQHADDRELVNLALTQLRHQVRWVVSMLDQQANVVDELISPLIAARDNVAHVHLDTNIDAYQIFLNQNTHISFGWAAYLIPAMQDEAVSDPELVSALSEIASLRAQLFDMGFSQHWHDYMQGTLKALEEAVLAARFVGRKPLEKAVRFAAQEFQHAREELAEEAKNMSSGQSQYLNEAAEKLDKVGKIAGGFSAFKALASDVVTLISNSIVS